MEVFVVCNVGKSKIKDFCQLEEYKVDREVKRGSFSRNGKLPQKKCFRLLLPNSIFKLEYGQEYQFIIDNDPHLPKIDGDCNLDQPIIYDNLGVYYKPVTDFINIADYSGEKGWLPAQLVWIIELR